MIKLSPRNERLIIQILAGLSRRYLLKDLFPRFSLELPRALSLFLLMPSSPAGSSPLGCSSSHEALRQIFVPVPPRRALPSERALSANNIKSTRTGRDPHIPFRTFSVLAQNVIRFLPLGLPRAPGVWAVRSRNLRLSVSYSWKTPGF
jgi:hypothetical protein